MKCPCCGGSGRIALTQMQFRVWDIVRRAGPDGISAAALTERAYADRDDGGPVSGTHAIWVHAHHANKSLKAIGQRITSTGGPGSVYRLITLSGTTATAAPADHLGAASSMK
jgi:hypothetical protein